MKNSKSYNINWIKKYILSQGPIEYFVHHNTLHSFEEYNFFDALRYSSSLYQAKTHKSLRWYQRKYTSGRITSKDIDWVLNQKFNNTNFSESFCSFDLIKSIMMMEISSSTDLKETIFQEKIDKLLPRKKQDIPDEFRGITTIYDLISPKRKNEFLYQSEVMLSHFFSAFYDKGISYWGMDNRFEGLLSLFMKMHDLTGVSGWKNYLSKSIKENKTFNAIEIIDLVLIELNVPKQMQTNFLFQTIFKMKGWAALCLSLEDSNSVYNPTKIKSDFNEFIAIVLLVELSFFRLIRDRKNLDYFDYVYVDSDNRSDIDIVINIEKTLKDKCITDALILKACNNKEIQRIVCSLNKTEIIRIWQESYEMKLVSETVESLITKEQVKKLDNKNKVKYQVITCIDDREESVRRHFEESSTETETFGYAGHFGFNILYKGAGDVFFRPLCPVGVTPEFYVWEEITKGSKGKIGMGEHLFFHQSKGIIFGFLISLLIGILSFIPMIISILSPRLALNLKRKIESKLFLKDKNRLSFENNRKSELRGYKNEELASIVYSALQTIGLNKNFGKYVYVCGHGSNSLNNPHKAAYDCGACAGGRGIPNARLFAKASNIGEVRDIIKTMGITIPSDTIFIGGYHDTCNDDLLFFDIEESVTVEPDFIEFRKIARKVQLLDAKERVRKFENVNINISNENALKHVEGRVYTLAQPRPEYGHSTNALCIVGPRRISKDIFYDRRAFLVSYDMDLDLKNEIIKSLVGSIIPVCAGISLEYYFSFVDRNVFGSGVKQPHNIAGLMGVMNGHKGDLKLGLPWQMVEIHEPTRIVIVINASLDVVKNVLNELPAIDNLVKNEWIRLIISEDLVHYSYLHNGDFVDYQPHRNIKKIEKDSFPSSSLDYIENTRDIKKFKYLGGGL